MTVESFLTSLHLVDDDLPGFHHHTDFVPVWRFGILLAVDTIPDMCQTVNNVTADMAATTIVARFSKTPLPVVDSGGYEGEQDTVSEAMLS